MMHRKHLIKYTVWSVISHYGKSHQRTFDMYFDCRYATKKKLNKLAPTLKQSYE